MGTTDSSQKDENNGSYVCVNVSPSSKIRRISLVKKHKGSIQSPDNKQMADDKKDGNGSDDFPDENQSPPLKSRRISFVKRLNTKAQSPRQENNSCARIHAPSGLVAACNELVNLAVSRGSLDDITVIVVDLNHYKRNN